MSSRRSGSVTAGRRWTPSSCETRPTSSWTSCGDCRRTCSPGTSTWGCTSPSPTYRYRKQWNNMKSEIMIWCNFYGNVTYRYHGHSKSWTNYNQLLCVPLKEWYLLSVLFKCRINYVFGNMKYWNKCPSSPLYCDTGDRCYSSRSRNHT